MAKLKAKTRNALPSSFFGLPGSRATQQVKAGNLSPSDAAKIRMKANRKLGKSGDIESHVYGHH